MANVIRNSRRFLWIAAILFSITVFLGSSVDSAQTPAFSYAENAGDWLGENIANAGDVNNDGVDDIIVGARKYGGTSGLATVLSGVDGSILYRYSGTSNAFLGSSVAGIGDINGDGFGEFAIGEFSMPFGKIYIRSGIDGAILLTIQGGNYGTMGKAVAGIGDVNSDGIPDISIGVNGVVRVHSGSDGSLLYTLYADVAGITGFGYDGFKLSSAGDVNADGHDDIIVGAMYQSESLDCYASGKAYIFSGLDGGLLYSYAGESCQSYVGVAVSGVGDVNSDGYADFAVARYAYVKVYSGIDGSELYTLRQHGGSAWMSLSSIDDIDGDAIDDIVAGTHRGRYVIYSGATGLRAAWSDALDPGNMFGVRVVGAGDFDGNGIVDLAYADYQNNTNGEEAGILYGLPVTPGVDCCFLRGDYLADGAVNISDVTSAIARVFSGGSATACPEDADANGDGSFNIADITTLISYIFGPFGLGQLAQCAQ